MTTANLTFGKGNLSFPPKVQNPFGEKISMYLLFHNLRESVLLSNLEENLRLKILTLFSLRINFEVSPRQIHHIDDDDDGDDDQNNDDGDDDVN